MKRLLIACLLLALTLAACSAALGDTAASAFTLTPVIWDGVGLGKVAVPDGYELASEVHCSDDTTCL